jgi:hypothetical protein
MENISLVTFDTHYLQDENTFKEDKWNSER